MVSTLFDIARPSLPIIGESAAFPVRRIYCIGRNYAAHTKEMGGDPAISVPIFFMKPADAATLAAGTLPFPNDTMDLHHEVELVAALGSGGRNIEPADAMKTVYGYGVGIDLTKRDRQAEAKSAGQPWDRAKGFDRSALVSEIRPLARCGPIDSGRIWLAVNGETRQSADLKNMIWDLPNIIAKLSAIWALSAGDLIFTGTPEGVGRIIGGDRITAGIDEVGRIEVILS